MIPDSMNNSTYYRDTLTEMVTRLLYPGALGAREIVQNSKIAEAVLHLFKRVEEIESKVGGNDGNEIGRSDSL